MTHKLYIGTNTKLFQTGNEAEAYIRRMDELIDDIRDRLEFFFIPSFTSLERVVRAVGKRIRIGAQNMAWAAISNIVQHGAALTKIDLVRSISVDPGDFILAEFDWWPSTDGKPTVGDPHVFTFAKEISEQK